MAGGIAERDWKVFGELRKNALQRLCERILADAKTTIDAPDQSPHERYLALFKLIHERDKDIAEAFNYFSRSRALELIATMKSMDLFTEEELQRFSPEVHAFLERWFGA